jgi:hypothetical protein
MTVHPQNRVPQEVIDLLTALIRRDVLEGPDLRDIAVSVDAGEDEFTGAGVELWEHVEFFAHHYVVSARYLIDEACVCLDWPVAS